MRRDSPQAGYPGLLVTGEPPAHGRAPRTGFIDARTVIQRQAPLSAPHTSVCHSRQERLGNGTQGLRAIVAYGRRRIRSKPLFYGVTECTASPFPSSCMPKSPAPLDARHPTSPARPLLPLLLAPLAAVLVVAALMQLGGDQIVADLLYSSQGNQWALKGAWVTATLAHKGGKWASALAGLAVLLACVLTRKRHGRLHVALLYLFLAMVLSTALVAGLKPLTRMDCPWDLQRYGGTRPFIGLLQHRPDMMGTPACFPAGQASAGYAWLSLYFFALLYRPAWRWTGLTIGLLAGLLLGLAQQLRGAHFLSHDLATAVLCWCASLGLFALMRGKAARATQSNVQVGS